MCCPVACDPNMCFVTIESFLPFREAFLLSKVDNCTIVHAFSHNELSLLNKVYFALKVSTSPASSLYHYDQHFFCHVFCSHWVFSFRRNNFAFISHFYRTSMSLMSISTPMYSKRRNERRKKTDLICLCMIVAVFFRPFASAPNHSVSFGIRNT